MQSEDDQWLCPSFNSYSSNRLADIAAKVSDEVNGIVKLNEESLLSIVENDEDDNDDDDLEEEDAFEFALVTEEIYYDGKIRPIFPIFNRDLLYNSGGVSEKSAGNVENDAIKIPLKKLFSESDREGREPPSSSEEEDGELESAPPGTYCVWKAKIVDKVLKSKSTGSGSKRWRIRDLLRRSNSDGKDSFVFLTPKKEDKSAKANKKNPKAKAIAGGEKSFPSSSSSSPVHDALFTRSKATSNGNETPRRAAGKGNETPKRKTYLPYRQDLVGFFATVNTLGRTVPRF